MKRVDMEFVNGKGQKIRGFLFLPNKPVDEISCVIVSHGFTSSTQSNIHTAIDFVANDIACLIFDFAGGSKISISQGKFEDVSVVTEVDDLENVIKWVRENYNFKDLFLLGSSMGGFVSAIAAAKTKGIKGLMLLFPAFVIPDDARGILKQDGSVSDVSPAVREGLKKEVLEAHAAIRFEDAIKDYQGPVLLIHGTEDKIVPLSYSQKANEIYQDSNLVIYPSQGHGFDWNHKVLADEACIEFVKEHQN